MTDPLSHLWQRQNDDASFTEPASCRKRLGSLERRVHRRNLIEYVAGALIIGACAVGLVFFTVEGLPAYAISMLALMVGTGLVLKHLYEHGRTEPVERGSPCLDHFRRQLARQRDLLRSVPRWYLFPLVPGVLAFYCATLIEATPVVGLGAAVREIAGPLIWTAAFFIFVAWLNLRSARLIDRKIARLDGED